MITQPTPRQLQAIMVLRGAPEWETGLAEVLSLELAAVKDKLVATPDEATIRKLQGAALLLSELQALVLEARDRLDRARPASGQ